MSVGWRARVQVILTLFMILTASPLAMNAQVATPVPETETPVPTDTLPPSPGSDEEDAAGNESSGEPTAVPQQRQPVDTSSDAGTTAEGEGTAYVAFLILICEDDDRVGTFELMPITAPTAYMASNTGDNCTPFSTMPGGFVSFLPQGGGDPITAPIEATENVFPVPAGSYLIEVTYQGFTGTSGLIDLVDGQQMVVMTSYFVAETMTPPVGDEGTGDVSVATFVCKDSDRAGEMSFLIIRDAYVSQAASECTLTNQSFFKYSLINTEDSEDVRQPDTEDGGANFSDVPVGTWILQEDNSGAQSEPFVVVEHQPIAVLATSWVANDFQLIDVFVEKVYCEDNDRAGTTEFTLDTPPNGMAPQAVGSTCYTVPPFGETPVVTVTLNNLETGITGRATLEGNSVWLNGVPTGTYTVTESADGMEPITSPEIVILETGKRVRIINYIPETSEQPEPGEGSGWIQGMVLYCSSPDREDGDVDFFISTVQIIQTAASLCEVGEGHSETLLQLFPVDPSTGEPDLTSPIAVEWFGVFFGSSAVPAGQYMLGYVSPFTGEMVLSEAFVVQADSPINIDINVYSNTVYLTDLTVWKDFCVDPARAGGASFHLTGLAPEVDGAPEFTTTAATDCRWSDDSDGELGFTLTNVDSSEAWTGTIGGDGELHFSGLLSGTYTLAETYNGTVITSDPFTIDATSSTYQMYVRNYVAEKDWTEPEPGVGDAAYPEIYGYICQNPDRDGGAEFFRYGSQDDVPVPEMAVAAASNVDTSQCRMATEADGLAFIAAPADDEGDPVEFELVDYRPGTYAPTSEGMPAGDYVITETTTGASTGIVRFSGGTHFDFLKYDLLPTSEVTLNVSSTDEAIANTLPEGATWAITGPTGTLSGTFDGDDRDLETSFTLDTQLQHGSYLVEVDAAPTFERYSMSFTVDGPEETFDVALIPWTGSLTIYKDVCDDPERVGETFFHFVLGTGEVQEPGLTAQSTGMTNCRLTSEADGTYTYTLTNLDTMQTWTTDLSGPDPAILTDLVGGTYTLAEAHDGATVTSEPFAYDNTSPNPVIYSRSFVNEIPPTDGSTYIEVQIYAYICESDDNTVIAEFFHYGPNDRGDGEAQGEDVREVTEAHCRLATEADGLGFTAIPEDEGTDPISFSYLGDGFYISIPAPEEPGVYNIVETSSGASTGPMTISGVHFLDFLSYSDLPTSSVSLNVSSADSGIADTLPAGTTVTVSRNDDVIFDTTFGGAASPVNAHRGDE